ncbi:MAG: hypothetical protein RL522_1443 [Pseudomonadota bacterium]|jgi:hypothetical protein
MWVNARANEKAPGRTAKGLDGALLSGFELRTSGAR